MKGLKAAVALLKQDIVVSDKVWKKRQRKNRESEGRLECLISLSAEENTHRGRLYPWWKIYDIGDYKSIQGAFHTTERISFCSSICESVSICIILRWTLER